MFTPGAHAGFVLIRLKNVDVPTLLLELRALFQRDDAESWTGYFVVLSDRKLRVRRPK
jgi:hypothetical protein